MVAKRCYRLIESPGGANLLWDLPLIVACAAASQRLGDDAPMQSARTYVARYLEHGQSDSGLLWWGNHYYLKARPQEAIGTGSVDRQQSAPPEQGAASPPRVRQGRSLSGGSPTAEPTVLQRVPDRTRNRFATRSSEAQGGPVWFAGNEPEAQPMTPEQREAPRHETRPISIPWHLLNEWHPDETAAMLRGHDRHLAEGGPPGAFNRHADRKGNAYAFLEAGANLAEALAWRATLSSDTPSADAARAVLGFSASFNHRDTGLLPVSPYVERWDRHHCTSEVGYWAGGAFRVAELLNDAQCAELALGPLAAWHEQAWNEQAQAFAGRVRLADGGHDAGVQTWLYQPGTWSDFWRPLFPAHDYPFPCAEACLTAWARTGDAIFRTAAVRWLTSLEQSLPARNGLGGYAEQYGRAVHLAWRAGCVLGMPCWTDLAWRLAEEALSALGADGFMRSHPYEDRCDAVDGMGWLLLALLSLHDNADPDTGGLHW
jgi:hypothetical protein